MILLKFKKLKRYYHLYQQNNLLGGITLICAWGAFDCHCQLKRDHLFAPKRGHLSQKFLAHGNLTFLILSPITWSGNFNHFSMMS